MDEEKLIEEIRKSPYKFICDFAENLYPFVGKDAFEILSLVIVSMFIKDIQYMSKRIRANMNCMFLTPSGGGKSSICSLFALFCFNPIEVKSITPAELEDRCFREEEFSLIVEDYATMSTDERVNKIIEGVIGEEKIIDRHTKQKDLRKHINAIGLLAGVPSDLSNKLTSGTIFRMIPLVIMLNDDEHSETGNHISKNIGISGDFDVRENIIKEYYNTLYRIQNEEREMKESGFCKINGFIMTNEIRDTLRTEWERLTRFYRKNAPYNFFRELWDGYRMLFAHCFLNYFNRERKGDCLVVTKDDLEVALFLMKKTMGIKYELLMSERLIKGIKNLRDLEVFMKSKNIPHRVKGLIHSQIIRNIK